MKPVDLSLPYTHTPSQLVEAFARKAHLSLEQAAHYAILRKSIDARKKSDIRIVYQLTEDRFLEIPRGVAELVDRAWTASAHKRVVVVGAGPAGLFAALYLALAGLQPLLIERGRPVEQRQLDVARFWNGGPLDPESNVQFGEGGAGTFSDGKLTTGIRDPRIRAVLEEFVLLGAPPEILFLSKPHIGTDRLRTVVAAMRQKIVAAGGEVRFQTRLTGVLTGSASAPGGPDQVRGIRIQTGTQAPQEIPADAIVLAIGHSARDTFGLLKEVGVAMSPKPFSVGVRIEHCQSLIDRAQYGPAAGHPSLPPAEYKLSCPLDSGRTLYSFCMCPGGQVIAAASADGEVVTNGMSHFSRDGENANSALLVPVRPEDFATDDPLAGMHFQQQIERKAFAAAGQAGKAPAQRVGDFLSLHGGIAADRMVNPTYANGVAFTDLADVLPAFVLHDLKDGLPLLARKLHGFADPGAVLTGVETRSSSPVRIVRDESGQSSLAGLFPCGEGAGYAGGIMSAAVDGLRCAEKIVASGLMGD